MGVTRISPLGAAGAPKSGAKSGTKRKPDDVSIGRYLCSVLRHKAVELGLNMRPDGYIKLSEVLAIDYFAGHGITEADVERLVANNTKQRYGLDVPEGEDEVHIRAHQGHTMSEVNDEALLQEVTSAEELPVLCHGTFSHLWPTIQVEGLRTMGRNHIHCVAVDLTAEEHRGVVLSGTRGECDVVVFIDVPAAVAQGVSFQWSENGVVLTRGIEGTLAPELFAGVSLWDWETEQWSWEDWRSLDDGRLPVDPDDMEATDL